MAARRKKKASRKAPAPAREKKHGKDTGAGSALQEAMLQAGIAPAKTAPKGKDGGKAQPAKSKVQAPAEDTAATQPRPIPTPPPPKMLSPEEAMAAAFEAIDDRTIHDAKFRGGGTSPFGPDTLVAEPGDEPEEEPEPEDDEGLTSEDLLFVEAMGTDIKRIENATARIREHSFTGLRWHSARQLDTLSSVDLHEPTLDGKQRDLLKRSRRSREPMPVLNVRHRKRREAIGEIEAFISLHRREGARFVRIVTGKGRQSRDGEPILKPALITWCASAGESHVLGWAPETDQSGRYGSLVLELRPWNRSKT